MISRLLVFLAVVAAARAEGLMPAQIADFGREFCFKCHGAERKKGDFDFEPLARKADVLADRKAWEKVAELLENREMPPDDKPQPPEELRAKLVEWIDHKLTEGEAAGANPGRVTLRRLNNDEYRNTIRDLLAVDFDPKDFPADETAYGFTTIADALTLPPILMEKYLDAAEQIVSRALAADRMGPPVRTVRGRDFRGENEWVQRMEDDALGFFREGAGVLETKFDADGDYTLRIRSYGEQAGPEPPKLAVSLDGAQIAVLEVRQRGRPRTYEVKTQIKAGTRKVALAYLNNYNDQDSPDPKLRGDRNVFVTAVEIVGPMHIRQEPPESFKRIFSRLPEAGQESALAREILRDFASRAYRRPATDAEVARLAGLAEAELKAKVPFTEAVGVAVQAVLCSPMFLFRWELDPAAMKPGEIRNLNEYELASRLSYFLWSSMPDAGLTALAAKGELSKQLAPQVARMLKDPRSKNFTGSFAEQWLQIRALDEVDIDRRKFPKMSSQLREAMRAESRMFFDAVVREDRGIFELIEADFTFANNRLAALYGLPEVKGDSLQRVALPPGSVRGGVMGQAAVLLATSMPARTSPVIRGKWVLEQLLGTPPPPAPANVPPLEETKVDANAPLRVRLEQHRQNPDCATCHAKIDPVGFALENFDAIGEWRTEENGAVIDTSAELPGGKKLGGFQDLRTHVKSDRFVRTLAENMLTYATGRGLERYDKHAVDRIVATATEGGSRMSALITAVVTSDPFLKRRRESAAR